MDAAEKITGSVVIDWLSGKLADERRSLETLHKAMIADLKLKLDSLVQVEGVQGNGISTKLGEAASQSQVAVPIKDLSQITPQEPPASGQNPPGNGGKNTEAHHQKDAQTVLAHGHSKIPNTLNALEIEKEAQNFFQKIVLKKRFEWFFGIVIIVHIVFMAMESQYVGLGIGHDIGYPDYSEPRDRVWPAAATVFKVFDIIFGTLYTIELVLKILAHRLGFFIDPWNVLDFVIVALWYLEHIFSGITLPIDTMLLRLLRLAKLLRLVKVLRSLTGFEQLFLMLTALKGSMRILCWVALLLFSCLIAFALLLNQILVGNVLERDDVSLEAKQRCFRYFGSFSRSLFSMFEMTLANWTILGRFLLEDVGETLGMLTIIYKLTMGFTVIAVINGCFIKETFKLAEQDDLLMIIQKDKERQVHTEKMLKLLDMADTKGDGTLTRNEFIDVCMNPEVDKWLGAQGLRVTDAGAIFDLIDPGEGILHKQELVAGARKLQGNARSLDVAKNHANSLKSQADITSILNFLHEKFDVQFDGHTGQLQDLHSKLDEHAKTILSMQAPAPVEVAEANASSSSRALTLADFKRDMLGLMGEIAEIRKVMSSQPYPGTNGSQIRSLQDASKQKVLWGCS